MSKKPQTAEELKITALEAEVESLKAKVTSENVIAEYEGVQYEIVSPTFMLNGKTYTAEEAATDPSVMADLVAMKAGFLRPV